MSGLGTDVLGVWPLGYTSLPKGDRVGLLRAVGTEPRAVSRQTPVGLSLVATQPASPVSLTRVSPENTDERPA